MKKIVISTAPGLLPHIQPLLTDTLSFVTGRARPGKTEDQVWRMVITGWP